MDDFIYLYRKLNFDFNMRIQLWVFDYDYDMVNMMILMIVFKGFLFLTRNECEVVDLINELIFYFQCVSR